MPIANRPALVPVALTTMALVAAAALASPAARAAAPKPAEQYRPVRGGFVLDGRGFGHGRGMSQWGSYQQAQQGRSWRQIIGFYYPGASLARAGGTIRVSTAGHTGWVARVVPQPGLVASDGAGHRVALATSNHGTRITSWEINAPSRDDGRSATLWFRTAHGRQALRSTTTGHWTITSPTGSIRAQDAAGNVVGTYLGTFTGSRGNGGMIPVVTTSLENYTRQVVPWENVASWPTQAQAAQAVAARSYGAWFQRNPRSAHYDICDTTSCQVFGGIGQETSRTRQGVAATAGLVLTHNGSVARSEFGSSNGGEVAPSGTGYSPAKADPYDAALPASINRWTRTLGTRTIQARYPQLGTVTSLVITKRDGYGAWGGRVEEVRLVGSKGSVTLSVDSFNALASNWRGNYWTIKKP